MARAVCEQKVRDGFSDAALRYDSLADVHKNIGRRLIEKASPQNVQLPLLDIGMGTGWFTQQLTAVFPTVMVVGLDFAPGMVSRAREREGRFKIVLADAASLPFKEETFDMIVSNLAYQWVEDLPLAFAQCRTRLSRTGKLYLTMFGRETFRELFSALDTCLRERSSKNDFTIHRLADRRQVENALTVAGFRSIHVESEYLRAHFPDMMSLVKWIKDIGANALSRDVYMGKDLFHQAGRYYNARFKDPRGVYATFEVIWVEAGR
ncbi:MAG: methyltransferase domain-containing protein [Candidatus Omnitrophica bacterium]|nr:methyltransferase domain-containing protein [Candidatus Omnitrophota bacterium]